MKRIASMLAIASVAALPVGTALAQQPSGAPAGVSTAGQQQVLVGSDSLVGSTVRNSEGRDLGKVDRLMIDPNDGRVTSVVVATGGTLGMGSSTISLPWNAIKVGQDRGKLIVIANQNLDNAPKAERSRDRAGSSERAGTGDRAGTPDSQQKR